MSWDDFCTTFDDIGVCAKEMDTARASHPKKAEVYSPVLDPLSNASGPYPLSPSTRHAHLIVGLHQQDERCEGADAYHDFGIAVLRKDTNGNMTPVGVKRTDSEEDTNELVGLLGGVGKGEGAEGDYPPQATEATFTVVAGSGLECHRQVQVDLHGAEGDEFMIVPVSAGTIFVHNVQTRAKDGRHHPHKQLFEEDREEDEYDGEPNPEKQPAQFAPEVTTRDLDDKQHIKAASNFLLNF